MDGIVSYSEICELIDTDFEEAILINLPEVDEIKEGDLVIAEVSAPPIHENIEEIVPKPKQIIPNKKNWKRNVRKNAYQAGKEHVSTRGKIREERKIVDKKNCINNCKYNCGTIITNDERKTIFENFYSMDQTGKYNFILKTTQRFVKKRCSKKPSSRREYSYVYLFDIKCKRIQVCKSFYLSTLAISQKPVYTVHNKKCEITNTLPTAITKVVKKKINDNERGFVVDYINSFPRIQSHYCRAKTSKEYLDSNLNISKMYDLYKDKCTALKKNPVKQSYFRFTFNTNFSLDFHKPKSDRCGKCEINMKTTNTDREYQEHVYLKNRMRITKENDKKGLIPIIIFDLENVLTCPKTEIGEAFYLSKLNVYNLTAHVSTTKRVYCAIWTEYTSGRSGNDIASAFYKILGRIFEEHDFKEFITWSDSCVPQNKNSFIAYAMQYFLQKHPDLELITMKYSIPGHSALQEVDNIHSQIEKVLKKKEYFSPLGLIRILKQINRKNPFTIIQMGPDDFKDFEKSSKIFNYKQVPFARVKMLRFGSIPHIMFYNCTNYEEKDFVEINLKPLEIRRSRKKINQEIVSGNLLNDPPKYTKRSDIAVHKKKHLIRMFQYMNPQDISFYKTILHLDECNQFNEDQPTIT